MFLSRSLRAVRDLAAVGILPIAVLNSKEELRRYSKQASMVLHDKRAQNYETL
jgi:hypothetical protein